MAGMKADELKSLAAKLGWTPEEADFLVSGPVNPRIRGMVALGAEDPNMAKLAREQVQQLMGRRANQTGGFISDILKRLGVR